MNTRRASTNGGGRRASTNNSSDEDDNNNNNEVGGVNNNKNILRNFGSNNKRRSSNQGDKSDEDVDNNIITSALAGPAGAIQRGVGNVTRGAVSNVGKAFTSLRRGGNNKNDNDDGNNNDGTIKTRRLFSSAQDRISGSGGGKTNNNNKDPNDPSKSTHQSRKHLSNNNDKEEEHDDDDDDNNSDSIQRHRSNDSYDSEAITMDRTLDSNAASERNNNNKSSASKVNDAFSRRRGGNNNNNNNNRKSDRIGNNSGIDTNILDTLPIEYRYNPRTASPVLHYLPLRIASIAARSTHDPIQLRSLLTAAQGDIRLHRARVQAALERDMKLIRTYQLDNDIRYKERCQRLQERKEMVTELRNEKEQILKDLKDGAVGSRISGLTQSESAQLQLVRWQRALELYVYDTARNNDDDDDNNDNYNNNDLLNWQSVFEKLLDGISEDQDISQILVQASDMCQKLVRETEKSVEDSAQYMADLESAYIIRLEAHEMFARSCLQQVGNIEEQFRTAGQAALRIGHQLENAELKRSQCEAASILIRRWWIMESLAEQEASSNELIPVEMEMNGGITPNACRLDHLFTKRENSLEASKALKQLRAVVRSRGNAAAGGTSSAGTAMIIDKSGSKRLDLTSDLIKRVSDSLEERLLNSFSIIYNAGGNYDFSIKPRPGGIDWRELRGLAQALLLFDSGRNLHKRYVEMVLENRFPELFNFNNNNKNKIKNDEDILAESMQDANLNTFDMDATRTKLSTLFHRVSEVCTAEFELIAHVFTSEGSRTDLLDGSEEMPLVVARALLQRVISDPQHGLQSRVNDLLASIDRQGDFDSGAKKLDTFVIIHEKAAGLFNSLRDAADRMMLTPDETSSIDNVNNALNAVESLKGFLTSQELALSNQHRQSYINLELRLLHHDCCACLDQAGCTLVKGPPPRPDNTLADKGILEEYRAPILPLHKLSLEKSGFNGILTKPLKPAVLRQPIIHATDSLSRARLMFGTSNRGGETTSRVILSIYNQMCCFYGQAFLYPIMETLKEMLPINAPNQLPSLPFNEEEDAHDLGVSPAFWVALERIHSAAKSFDRELWSEKQHNHRVWDTIEECGDKISLNFARSERNVFYSELERRGELAILRALDTISTHVQWIIVTGGESMLANGGSRMLGSLTGGAAGGPYAIPAGSSLDTPNSPAVKALAYCLRVQFVHIQAALSIHSLANFWTALSMRLYDILVARLLQHYYISTVGAVILSRDVEALRSVAMLAGTEHSHWDMLRELLTLYMTPPDAIRGLLTGPSEGDISKGLFTKAGKDKCLVFLSRRNDYRYKTTSGLKKSGWVIDMLNDLKVTDPTDNKVNIGLFAAGRKI